MSHLIFPDDSTQVTGVVYIGAETQSCVKPKPSLGSLWFHCYLALASAQGRMPMGAAVSLGSR